MAECSCFYFGVEQAGVSRRLVVGCEMMCENDVSLWLSVGV